jgi:plastocyanin
MGFISEWYVKFLDSWDEFNEWCGGGSRGLLAVAALALLIIALLAVVLDPGLIPTGDDGDVVADETPTKPIAETKTPVAPTVVPTYIAPDIPTPTTESAPLEAPVTTGLPELHTIVINPYITQKFEFDPINCTIARNDSVIWINEDTSTEGIYILTSAEGLWQPANIRFGSEFIYTFNSSGTYHYGCEYFQHINGTIIVK